VPALINGTKKCGTQEEKTCIKWNMEVVSQRSLPSAIFSEDSWEEASPFSQTTVILSKKEYIQLKWDVNYWRRQHARVVERERALKKEVEHWKAQVRDLKQRLYGKKSEKSAQLTSPQASSTTGKRGHQKDAPRAWAH
jgi:hypothetical protein